VVEYGGNARGLGIEEFRIDPPKLPENVYEKHTKIVEWFK
jgi:hypothetical protein